MASFLFLVTVNFGIQTIMWAISSYLVTEKYYDLTGSFTYLLVTFLGYGQHVSIRNMLVSCMHCVWAARLGSFLYFRVVKFGHDSRFEKVKSVPKRFLIYWEIQGVWILLTNLPIAILNIYSNDSDYGTMLDYLGTIIFVFGFFSETVSDAQKLFFKLDPANKGKFIQSGLWNIVRFPNYAGEILVQLGITLVSFSGLDGVFKLIIFLSPVFISILLINVSGINLQVRQQQRRWGEDASFKEYVANKYKLIPYLY
eukprot:TRINITY_DN10378_c0_g1_i1.p1 TRINITY_DN10378_c0_g1~~TRINITY_DN10378_c0_g1_i1.p1  ORF type:complete len:255 (+),score=26.20 TRINITY_DN10378_c0_g1_i1:248-1012(+)